MPKPSLPVGGHGNIRLTNKGNGRWRADCRFRDYDGVHLITRATPPHIADDPGGVEATAEMVREITHRRRLLGLEQLDRRQRLPFSPHGCFVYLLWGNDRERPLYVGQSANVLRRLGQHIDERGRQIRDFEVISCDSRPEMDRLEQVLIETLKPMWNTTFNGAAFSVGFR
ncbi:MAG: GIY-YIG nuclease family protein [Armatimonadia bacterium]